MNYFAFEGATRVPLLSEESLRQYHAHNVLPHKGTSYGERELKMYREMKLANRLGKELIGIPDAAEAHRLNDDPANKDS